MRFEMKKDAGEVLVTFFERLTFSDNTVFRSLVEQMKATSTPRWVFDFSGLDFMDSAGLGMLLIARDTAMQMKAELELRGARGDVERLFRITKVNGLFKMAA